ncbi:uncharacterized protein LOC142984459 [Anticarsia gemmatalis]|uniref:uncharacterized protein LOC142984459 n=1 Tax=Anticarsia gemmatalis TaxID=129554 RepID=UPI003F75C8AD
MASGYCKSDKPELVAIYRLEFYKNKKKWKLSNDKPKQPLTPPPSPSPRDEPQTPVRPNLNVTYNVSSSESDKELTSPLNDAFLNDVPLECALKPEPPTLLEDRDAVQLRRTADHWLNRLLRLYQQTEDCSDWEDYQEGVNDSTDFIREAHEIPHSSEKDPDETGECSCSLVSTPLPGLSSRSLSAAILHATRALRHLLTEQLIRDQIRSRTLSALEEYPTRDTQLFGTEYVTGGSHLTCNTNELQVRTDSVIKIVMGRPYRR